MYLLGIDLGVGGSVSGAHPQAWSSTCRNYHSWRSFGQEGHPSSCLSSQTCQRKHWMSEHQTNCKGSSGSLKSQQLKVEKPSSSIALVPSVPHKLVDKVLFSYDEFVKLFNWDLPTSAPCGFLNCGNR